MTISQTEEVATQALDIKILPGIENTSAPI